MLSSVLKVVRADTDELFQKSVALQKMVYCLEYKYEDMDHHLDPDAFDDYDLAGQTRRVLITTDDNFPVSTGRIITPGKLELPVLKKKPRIKNVIGHKIPVTECSGFCISNIACQALSFSIKDRLKIFISLITSLCLLTKEEAIDHSVMLVSRGFWRHLRIVGATLKPVGSPVHHHGERLACWALVEDILSGVDKFSFNKGLPIQKPCLSEVICN